MPSGLLIGALLAQTVTSAPVDSGQLERMRQALDEKPAIVVDGGFDRPVFRVNVEGWKFNGPPWEERASFVRPGMPMYHFEYLQMVTPEAFRASTLYPGAFGIPIGQLIDALGKKIGEARRRKAEANARAEVAADLEALFACRADPARPGC